MCSREAVGFLLTVSAGIVGVAAVVLINVLPWDSIVSLVFFMFAIVWIFLGPAIGLLLFSPDDDEEDDDGDDGGGSLSPVPSPADSEIAELERLYAMPSQEPAHEIRARVFIFSFPSFSISSFTSLPPPVRPPGSP